MDSYARILIGIAEKACRLAMVDERAAQHAALIAVAEHYTERAEAAAQAAQWAETALARREREIEARRLRATVGELEAKNIEVSHGV